MVVGENYSRIQSVSRVKHSVCSWKWFSSQIISEKLVTKLVDRELQYFVELYTSFRRLSCNTSCRIVHALSLYYYYSNFCRTIVVSLVWLLPVSSVSRKIISCIIAIINQQLLFCIIVVFASVIGVLSSSSSIRETIYAFLFILSIFHCFGLNKRLNLKYCIILSL